MKSRPLTPDQRRTTEAAALAMFFAPDRAAEELGRRLTKEAAAGRLRGGLWAGLVVVLGCGVTDGDVGPLFGVGMMLGAILLWSIAWGVDRWAAKS